MAKIGLDANIDSVRHKDQASAPTTTGAGYSHIFTKADGVYVVDENDVVTGPLAIASADAYTEGARVYNNADIELSNATLTALTFNSERWDTDNIHDVGSASVLTCKTAGKYSISVHASFDTDDRGVRELSIRLNGTTMISRMRIPPNTGHPTMLSVSTIWDLNVDDYVEAIAYQSSGDPLDVLTVASYSPEFAMQRIG